MSFHLHLKREKRNPSTPKTTLGKLYLDGAYFSFTLEDAVRPHGVKIPGQTAIPAGLYNVKVTMSSRFKRLMPMIYNQANGYEIIAGGISFKGCRLHGGNTHHDTEGCPLVAKQKISNEKIYGSMEKALTKALIERGGEGTILIENNAS